MGGIASRLNRRYVIEQEKVNKRKMQEEADKRQRLQRSCNDAVRKGAVLFGKSQTY